MPTEVTICLGLRQSNKGVRKKMSQNDKMTQKFTRYRDKVAPESFEIQNPL